MRTHHSALLDAEESFHFPLENIIWRYGSPIPLGIASRGEALEGAAAAKGFKSRLGAAVIAVSTNRQL